MAIDLVRHVATVRDVPVNLTRSEFQLLRLLVGRPGEVFARRQIMEELWQTEFDGDERACDVHISNLRQKVERDPQKPELVVTVRGRRLQVRQPRNLRAVRSEALRYAVPVCLVIYWARARGGTDVFRIPKPLVGGTPGSLASFTTVFLDNGVPLCSHRRRLWAGIRRGNGSEAGYPVRPHFQADGAGLSHRRRA